MKQSAFEFFKASRVFHRLSVSPCTLVSRLEGVWWFLKANHCSYSILSPISSFALPSPLQPIKKLPRYPWGIQVHALKPSLIFSPEFGISFMNLLSHTYGIRETYGLLLNSPLHFPVPVGLMKWTAFYGWVIRSHNLRAKREWKNNRLVSEWYWARQILNQFALYYRYRVTSE